MAWAVAVSRRAWPWPGSPMRVSAWVSVKATWAEAVPSTLVMGVMVRPGASVGDQEKRNALGVEPVTGFAGGDDEVCRLGAVEDVGFGAGEGWFRREGDVGEVVARVGLGMGEGDDAVAGDDLFDKACVVGEQWRGEGGGEEWLQRAGAAEGKRG